MSSKRKPGTGVIAASLVAGGIGLAFAAYTLVAKTLVEIAFDRKLPKLPKGTPDATKAIGKMNIDQKLLDEALAAAAKLEKAEDTETVEIAASSDGTSLVGHYRPAEKPKRIIIAMHGWRSSWVNDFGMIADEWKEDRCSVIFAEQRGQNNSGGDYMGFGVTERRDCLDWVGWAIENVSSELPIYLFGLSMGATTVLMASGLGLPDNVHGIISDCGFTSPDAIWRHIMTDNLHMPYDSTLYSEIARRKVGIDTKASSTIDALKKNVKPVLFFHGTDDHFVPIEMTYENFKACTAPKRLNVVPGADHGLSHYVDSDGYRKAELAFFREFDKAASKDE